MRTHKRTHREQRFSGLYYNGGIGFARRSQPNDATPASPPSQPGFRRRFGDAVYRTAADRYIQRLAARDAGFSGR